MIKKKFLSKELTLYFKKNYPKYLSNKSHRRYNVCLGIGGNIGDVPQRFEHLLKWLKYDTRFCLLQTSPILKNPPFGYLEQNDFYNALLEVATDLNPFYLLKSIQRIEKKFGRVRSFKDAPRTLDIDIIFLQKRGKDIKIDYKDLTIPHKGWKIRESVKIPLSYMKNIKYTKFIAKG